MRHRGFEKVKYEEFVKHFFGKVGFIEQTYKEYPLPLRATLNSAGYDFCTLYDFVLAPGESIIIPTGVKAYMQKGEFLALYIRSGAGIKKGIGLKNQVGIIDADYYNNETNDGHIMIAFTNFGKEEWKVKKGEAIAQGLFQQYLLADGDDVTQGARRIGGLGSTHKGEQI
jgi:dUTP pyrophosphatase